MLRHDVRMMNMKKSIVIAIPIVLLLGLASPVLFTMVKYRYTPMDAFLRCIINEPGETTLAEGFSEAKFFSIHLGMTRIQVEETLGPPLKRWNRDFTDCAWSYTWQTKATDSFDNRTVIFDTNGIVKTVVHEYYAD